MTSRDDASFIWELPDEPPAAPAPGAERTYTVAQVAARANLKPLLFSGQQPGGQLTITTEVENYPGFREGVMGPALMDEMREQVLRFGTEIVDAAVERVDFSQRPFTLWADGQAYTSRTVIVASGASAMLLGIETET